MKKFVYEIRALHDIMYRNSVLKIGLVARWVVRERKKAPGLSVVVVKPQSKFHSFDWRQDLKYSTLTPKQMIGQHEYIISTQTPRT